MAGAKKEYCIMKNLLKTILLTITFCGGVLLQLQTQAMKRDYEETKEENSQNSNKKQKLDTTNEFNTLIETLSSEHEKNNLQEFIKNNATSIDLNIQNPKTGDTPLLYFLNFL